MQESSNDKRNKTVKILITVLILIFFLAPIIIRFFIFELRWIPSGAMKPTLIEGDRIIVEKYSRFFDTPKRGDIILFYPPSTKLSNNPLAIFARLTGFFCKDVAYIKRIVGIPGDTIETKHEKDGSTYIYINGKKYNEDYVENIYDYPPCPDEKTTDNSIPENYKLKCSPITLEKDSYFMVGDNRGNSYDSRYFGAVKKDRFIGRAVLIYAPSNRVKVLQRLK